MASKPCWGVGRENGDTERSDKVSLYYRAEGYGGSNNSRIVKRN